ncbi:hypoxia-inducible factor 1-alpha-like isoform X2 [Xenia sp. Carnegie-2017]|uniref:hypoxia-inducible factor 1-alpha-like isoform X2 n=1 Tax=Xenia sp. Carnegie-2017 TaxID=2897299 RepID=UPI001F033002|nr:hypoxia-inducible factor 1-alpha-like isoform X2 [Xenia sp. Carnegie-2017]
MASKYYTGQEHLKRKSREAAKCRRGQQNDEYSELASQLPLGERESSQLDRLSVMRLTNSFIKIKHFLNSVSNHGKKYRNNTYKGLSFEKKITQALDGFVFVIGDDGQFLFISDNVKQYLGLLPIEVAGSSFYKFIHPCDHEEVAKQLGGKIPLEDMEIFDGLFCSDSIFLMSNNLKRGSSNRHDIENHPYRSFFVRMKSTLTSRGKSVNLKASTYRVVHCMGCIKFWLPSTVNGSMKTKSSCFVGIGVPLMFSPTFEVPLDRCTFTSHHSLDLKFIFCEEGIEDVLGYTSTDVVGQSLYKFHHGRDNDVLTECHKTLLTKGQSVSGYYRLLAKYGGWIWVQTKASIVYASKTCEPQFVLCIHSAISDIEMNESIVSLDQVQKIKEREETPTNSPDNRDEFEEFVGNMFSYRVLNRAILSCLNDHKNKKSEDATDVDAGYDSPVASSINDNEEDFIEKYSPMAKRFKDNDSGCDGDVATDLTDDETEVHPDVLAPFIPPPPSDTPLCTNVPYNMEFMEESLSDDDLLWGHDSWEIYDAEADTRSGKDPDSLNIKRTLSTPKFSLLVDDPPLLKNCEVEKSAPVLNLPFLHGDEFWFDANRGNRYVV